MTFTEPAADAAGDAACGVSRRFRGGLDVGHGAAAACASRRAADDDSHRALGGLDVGHGVAAAYASRPVVQGPRENLESVKIFLLPVDDSDVG